MLDQALRFSYSSSSSSKASTLVVRGITQRLEGSRFGSRPATLAKFYLGANPAENV